MITENEKRVLCTHSSCKYRDGECYYGLCTHEEVITNLTRHVNRLYVDSCIAYEREEISDK